MKKEKIQINHIPAIIWGEKSEKVFIAIHGNMSHKEDKVIQILASHVIKKKYQVISFDLPEHGDRKGDKDILCKVQNCVEELKQVLEYVKKQYDEISLFACSMSAYFSLLAYQHEAIQKSLFLSPVINMKMIIDNMMNWAQVSENELKEKQEIETDFGQTLYYDYYMYVKNHPIIYWNTETYILYGSHDDMQKQEIIEEFTKKFHVLLTILRNGEHYFHTEKQLEYYKNWLENII